MKCPHCSFENSPDAPFCQNCGEVFPARIDLPEIKTPSTDAKLRGAALSDVPPIVKVPEIPRPEVKRPTPEEREAPLPDVAPIPDLSGFERLVDSSYVPPAPRNSAGDTAELPRIEEEYVPRARSYTLGLDPKEQRKRDREQRKLEKKFAKQQHKEEVRLAKEQERLAAQQAKEQARAEKAARKAAEEEERRLHREAEEEARRIERETEEENRRLRREAEAEVLSAREGVASEADEAQAIPEAFEAPEAPEASKTSQDAAAPEGDAREDAPAASQSLEAVTAKADGVVELFEKRRPSTPKRGAHVSGEIAEVGLVVTGASDASGELAPNAPTQPDADEVQALAPAVTAAATSALEAPSAAGTPNQSATPTAEEAPSSRTAAAPSADDVTSATSATAAAPSKARPRRPRAVIIVAAVIAVIVVAAAVAASTYMAELWGGKSVPEVAGLGQQEATGVLQEKGFAVEAVDVKSDEAAGTVLGTDPGVGTRIEEGSTVILSVATPRIVPEVKGLSQQEAVDALAAEGLTVIEYKEKKSNKNEGTVLAVDPAAGEEVKADTPITLKVAIPFTVPDIEGKSEAEARKALEDEGYEVKIEQYTTEDIEEGAAVGTDPKAGTKLNSGSDVTLYVAHSRGTELRELTASILPGATLTIDKVTYQVQEVKNTSYRGDGEVNYTVTAKKYEVVALPFGLGEKTYFDDKLETIEGGIVWNDDNEVSYASPAIHY